MKNLLYLFSLSLGLLLTACSGSDQTESTGDEQDNTTAKEQSIDASASGDNEPKSLQEAMQQAQDAIKNIQGGQAVQPINFRELQELLTDKLAGYERTGKSGETAGAMGMNISRAEGKYKSGDKTIKVEIVDTGGLGMAMMGMAAWAAVTVDKEDENGYERTGTLDGYKCFEKFHKNDNTSELAVLVADRFIVTASNTGNRKESDMNDLKAVVKDLNLKKLAAMK